MYISFVSVGRLGVNMHCFCVFANEQYLFQNLWIVLWFSQLFPNLPDLKKNVLSMKALEIEFLESCIVKSCLGYVS